jgi:hypothetical protein
MGVPVANSHIGARFGFADWIDLETCLRRKLRGMFHLVWPKATRFIIEELREAAFFARSRSLKASIERLKDSLRYLLERIVVSCSIGSDTTAK